MWVYFWCIYSWIYVLGFAFWENPPNTPTPILKLNLHILGGIMVGKILLLATYIWDSNYSVICLNMLELIG